ncbi:MAG: hypothetical protein IT210_19910 [Armatimonadetes bacterium]|nr:hypothetical protein [Armatimonadota bacterium]
MKRFGWIGLMLFLWLAASLAAQESDEKITLQLNLNAGDQWHHLIVMDGTLTGPMTTEMTMKLAMTQKVLKVTDAGKYELQTKYTRSEMTMGNQPIQNPYDLTKMVITQTMDKSGKVEKVSGLPKEAGAGMGMDPSEMAQMFSASYFPGKPVGIGESWTNEVSKESAGQKIKVKIVSTLLGLQTQGGVAYARVKSVVDMPLEMQQGGMPMKGRVKSESVSLIDQATGMVYRSDGTMDMALEVSTGQEGQGMQIGMKGKIRLAPYDPVKKEEIKPPDAPAEELPVAPAKGETPPQPQE